MLFKKPSTTGKIFMIYDLLKNLTSNYLNEWESAPSYLNECFKLHKMWVSNRCTLIRCKNTENLNSHGNLTNTLHMEKVWPISLSTFKWHVCLLGCVLVLELSKQTLIVARLAPCCANESQTDRTCRICSAQRQQQKNQGYNFILFLWLDQAPQTLTWRNKNVLK